MQALSKEQIEELKRQLIEQGETVPDDFEKMIRDEEKKKKWKLSKEAKLMFPDYPEN